GDKPKAIQSFGRSLANAPAMRPEAPLDETKDGRFMMIREEVGSQEHAAFAEWQKILENGISAGSKKYLRTQELMVYKCTFLSKRIDAQKKTMPPAEFKKAVQELLNRGVELSAVKMNPKMEAEGHALALFGILCSGGMEKEKNRHLDDFAKLMLSEDFNIFELSPSAKNWADMVADYLKSENRK